MSDREEFAAARDAGLRARHETRLANARDREHEALAVEVDRWLRVCGACDAGLWTKCVCPKGDYRTILLKVWEAYLASHRAATAEIGSNEEGS